MDKKHIEDFITENIDNIYSAIDYAQMNGYSDGYTDCLNKEKEKIISNNIGVLYRAYEKLEEIKGENDDTSYSYAFREGLKYAIILLIRESIKAWN